jgi:hypothetical protein
LSEFGIWPFFLEVEDDGNRLFCLVVLPVYISRVYRLFWLVFVILCHLPTWAFGKWGVFMHACVTKCFMPFTDFSIRHLWYFSALVVFACLCAYLAKFFSCHLPTSLFGICYHSYSAFAIVFLSANFSKYFGPVLLFLSICRLLCSVNRVFLAWKYQFADLAVRHLR